jgi:cbb3-type cytochrome c oxidase subunit II
MKMTPALLVIGGLLIFWASVFVVIVLPWETMEQTPSAAWRTWTPLEEEGHTQYVKNGCSYCHSQFVRTIDWSEGAERIAEHGDYHQQNPAILGTERTGPDLSQEGGEHPDDWHKAHFYNPRYTRPMSLMPSWEFLGDEKIAALTAYVQSTTGTDADYRTARQQHWKELAAKAYDSGPDKNVEWLHAQVPEGWRKTSNDSPATAAGLARGKKIYEDFCVGCHGSVGDGQGPAAKHVSPPPLNFPTLRRHLIDGKYIGGILYYQIMRGITGTGMPYFKDELESAKIWDVSNYIAVEFIGYTDATLAPHGIDAAYEPPWVNTFKPPEAVGSGL